MRGEALDAESGSTAPKEKSRKADSVPLDAGNRASSEKARCWFRSGVSDGIEQQEGEGLTRRVENVLGGS